MAKQDIIDYVMNTPGNTNKMVLEGMLGDTDGVKLPEISEEDEGKVLTVIDGKWDKGAAGYSCTEERVTLTDESVTTTAGDLGGYNGSFAYNEPITAEIIRVTFNGVEYTCQRRTAIGSNGEYGAPYDDAALDYDFSEFPFNLLSRDRNDNNMLATETAGTYQVKIETVEESVETSECFEKAVEKVVGGSGESTLVVRADHIEGDPLDPNNSYVVYDKTWQEVSDALSNGKLVIIQGFGINITDGTLGNAASQSFATNADQFENSWVVYASSSLYACSADGYLQSKECESSGGGGID